MVLTWLCSRTCGSSPAPRGTLGFSHFSKSTRNRERQAMTDGINSEREYSGGQWFLNHLRGWTRSASSRRCNHAAGTPIGAKSAGTGKVKRLRLFIGWWQVIWKTADSCLMIISSIFKKCRFASDDVQSLFSYISCERGKTRRYSLIYFSFYFQYSNLKIYSKSLYLSLEEANTVQRGIQTAFSCKREHFNTPKRKLGQNQLQRTVILHVQDSSNVCIYFFKCVDRN